MPQTPFQPTESPPPPPGSPEARANGCICSSSANRNGAGLQRPSGLLFQVLYWCPVHGSEPREPVKQDERL